MATVHVTLCDVLARAETGSTMPVLMSQPKGAETLASGAVSTTGTLTAARAQDDFWNVTVTGGAVWVAFGTAPTAGPGGGYLVLDGQTIDRSTTVVGEKIAVRNA